MHCTEPSNLACPCLVDSTPKTHYYQSENKKTVKQLTVIASVRVQSVGSRVFIAIELPIGCRPNRQRKVDNSPRENMLTSPFNYAGTSMTNDEASTEGLK